MGKTGTLKTFAKKDSEKSSDKEGARKRSRHRGGGWSEEVGDQGSRPEILRNLRVRCGARRKRRLNKDAKRNPSEKEGCQRIVKGTRIPSRICCMPCGWRKRLDVELVRRLRSYIERWCSNKV